jgi:hypothetical protein
MVSASKSALDGCWCFLQNIAVVEKIDGYGTTLYHEYLAGRCNHRHNTTQHFILTHEHKHVGLAVSSWNLVSGTILTLLGHYSVIKSMI